MQSACGIFQLLHACVFCSQVSSYHSNTWPHKYIHECGHSDYEQNTKNQHLGGLRILYASQIENIVGLKITI